MRIETKIGMFRLVDNQLGGITFYPQIGHEDTGVWYMLNEEAVEQLKDWLNNKKKLEHDEYWNWNVKRGEFIRCDISENGLIEGEEYEVVAPQGTPRGICVKYPKTDEYFVGEHSWFSKIDKKIN